jgi:cytochrome c-type biogenesis protein CcmH/NrfG
MTRGTQEAGTARKTKPEQTVTATHQLLLASLVLLSLVIFFPYMQTGRFQDRSRRKHMQLNGTQK